MGRTSDTRARVRALAVVWTKEGRELSPRAVREALGGGSSTTIVDELRRFREERAAAAQSDPGRAAVLAELEVPFDNAPATSLGGPAAQPSSTPPNFDTSGSLAQAVAALSEQLAKALARFDAMQKRMLRDVDEARETARYWKDVAERSQAESRAQVEGYRQGMYKEMERANVLQGRLNQLTGVAG